MVFHEFWWSYWKDIRQLEIIWNATRARWECCFFTWSWGPQTTMNVKVQNPAFLSSVPILHEFSTWPLNLKSMRSWMVMIYISWGSNRLKVWETIWSIDSVYQSIIPFWYQLLVFLSRILFVNSRFQSYLLISRIRFHRLHFPSIDSLVISKVVKSRWSSPRHWFPEVKRTFRKNKKRPEEDAKRSRKKKVLRCFWCFIQVHLDFLWFC